MLIDLRSDTVTRPTPGMRQAMATAELGDDVFGDDPTVNRLQAFAAELFGFEAALWFPSGTQSNLAALMSHCGRGDEYLVGQEAHTYKYEGGGAAVLGSIQPQPLLNQSDGTIALADLSAAVKPNDAHFAMTRLLALENTISGRVLPPAYVTAALAFVRQQGLASHLDGARLCNAAIALNRSLAATAQGFDSVSVCLSKGLGAPAGSLLLGTKAFLARAHRARKMLGGGMRQVGILAAAGLYALQHQVARLADDHANAALLAAGLRELGIDVVLAATNMVFVTPPNGFAEHLIAHGIQVLPGRRLRLVTHLDVDEQAIKRVLAVASRFLRAA